MKAKRYGAVAAILPVTATAQQTAAALPQSGFGSMLQVAFGLAVVLGIMAAAAWLLRRFSTQMRGSQGVVKVVGGAVVGTRERVVLVEINDTWLVLGVAPGQVRALHTLARPDAPQHDPLPDARPGFNHWLKRTMERRNAG